MRSALAACCFICISISGADAEEIGQAATQSPINSNSASTVTTTATVFKPLTTWERVKLGAAYFTNPEKVQNSKIVFEFSPVSFNTEAQRATLSKLANDGKIWCAIPPDSNTTIVKAVPCTGLANFPAMDASFKIISSQSSLLGTKPTGVLVGRN